MPIIYHTRDIIPQASKYSIYNAFVLPHLLYASPFIFKASKYDINSLQRCINRVIKILFRIPKLTSTQQVYKILNIHSIDQIINNEFLKLANRIYIKRAPTNIEQHFKISNSKRRKAFLVHHMPIRKSYKTQLELLFNDM